MKNKNTPNSDGNHKSSSPALSKGIKVLELISSSTEPQSLTSISKNLGIAMSSTHSICRTLENEGYIEKRSDSSFELTLKVLKLASSKINQYDIIEHFYKICDDIPLIRENGATVTVLVDADVYFIACKNSSQPLGIKFTVGTRLPACCVASGRALLANLSNDEIKKLYPKEELPQITKANYKTRSELLDVIEIDRKNGFSKEKGRISPNMNAYGAVVETIQGKSIAGVSVSMYNRDSTPDIEKKAIESVCELAKRLSEYAHIL